LRRIWKTQLGCWSVSSLTTLPSIIPAPVFSLNACVVCSRRPAADETWPPSYIHVVGSYVPASSSHPEK
jgi:hypothetical protein